MNGTQVYQSLPSGFTGWLLIIVESPGAEGMLVVGEQFNSLSMTRAAIDNDIYDVVDGEIQRENPPPADAGDSWSIPFVVAVSGQPSWDTYAITVNTRNRSEWQATFKYQGWTEAGVELESWTDTASGSEELFPARMQYVSEIQQHENGYYPLVGRLRVETNTSCSHGLAAYFGTDWIFVSEAEISNTAAWILVDWDRDGEVEDGEQDYPRKTNPGLILLKSDTTPVKLGFGVPYDRAKFTLHLPEDQSLIKVKIDGVEKTGDQPDLTKGVQVTVESANLSVGMAEITVTMERRDWEYDRLVIWVVQVEAAAIKFDHKGPDTNTSDALNIRKDAEYDLDHEGNGLGDGEWLLDIERNEPALYVADKNVSIKAQFRVTPSGAHFTAKIKGCDDVVTWLNVAETEVSFSEESELSEYVEMPLVYETPLYVSHVQRPIEWVITKIDESELNAEINSSGPHEIFVVLDVPQSPWYDSDTSHPWASALRMATDVAQTADQEAFVAAATEVIWSNSKLTYETDDGLGKYYYDGPEENDDYFNLTDFIKQWDPAAVKQELNCADCAYGVQVISRLAGIAVVCEKLGSCFPVNCIDPIGDAPITNNCFRTPPAIGNDARKGGFAWHMVAEFNNKIYDACLSIDIDANPDNVVGEGGENPSPGAVQEDPQTFTWHKPRGNDGSGLYQAKLVDNFVMPHVSEPDDERYYTNLTPMWGPPRGPCEIR